MKKSFLHSLLVVATLASLSGDALAQTSSNSLSCPPNYALSIDPPPPPTDDPNTQDTYKPLSAAEKFQAEQQAKANEMSRWHCAPLESIRNQQPQQPAGGYNEQ